MVGLREPGGSFGRESIRGTFVGRDGLVGTSQQSRQRLKLSSCIPAQRFDMRCFGRTGGLSPGID